MEPTATILIVDDEPFNLDYLEQELDDLGYATVRAADGYEALAQVAAAPPDVVLLDIMMPGLDGFGVLAQLKSSPQWRDIPVIVISAMNDMGSVVKGISLGAEDYLPKPFNEVLLRARLETSVEKKRLRDAEQRYLRSIERELEIGRDIQAGFLPLELPDVPGWEVAAHFHAAREVAGDFYDAFALPDGMVGLLVGDVCGKGVGAALFMTLFRSLLRAGSNLELFTANAYARSVGGAPTVQHLLHDSMYLTNNYIATIHHSSSMFATIFFGMLDPATGSLHYINAGQEKPMIIGPGGLRAELKPTGPVAGLFADVTFTVAQAQLEPGETLLIFTDGVPDAKNAADGFFSREQVLAQLHPPAENANALLGRIAMSLTAHIGSAPQFDDITMLAVRRNG